MKVPLSWLREYIDLNNLSPEEIGNALTIAGLEVDSIDRSVAADAEVVFEISLTPNLGHCQSILGVARELSAQLQRPLKEISNELQERGDPIQRELSVDVRSPRLCPRYAARLIRDIRVGPSPSWMQRRLEAAGMRSINNVVDVTNYVMLELGQPLHPFDAAKIGDHKIVVAPAEKETSLVTLDGVNRTIPAGTLLICNGTLTPLAVGGVIGGLASSVNPQTRSVVLESAYFSSQAIRRTMKHLQLRTESGIRLEKGIDADSVVKALDRAAFLLAETSRGTIAPGVIDCSSQSFEPRSLQVRLQKINQILGTRLSLGEASSALQRLGMGVQREEQNGREALTVLVPTYRNDVQSEIDLVEEVGRVYGYNNIPPSSPHYRGSLISHTPLFLFEKEARAQLIAQGLQECLTCDLIGPQLAALTAESEMGPEALIRVLHPRSIDQSILRTSLLPGLLQTVKYNKDRQNDDLAIFEVGKVHFKTQDIYQERLTAGIVLTGLFAPYHFHPKPRHWDFFDLKGIVENVLEAIGVLEACFAISELHNFHPGRQAQIIVAGVILGVIGEVHPSTLRTLDIQERVLFAEINLYDILRLRSTTKRINSLPLYPSSVRDWTFTARETLPIGRVMIAINTLVEPLLENVILLDLYKSEQIGKDKKNLTFRFVYRDMQKTIDQASVDACHTRIVKSVVQQLREEIAT